MGRLAQVVAFAAHPERPASDTWISASLTYSGLEALGVPRASLDSFAWELRQGMAARAKALGDVGENAPEHWEWPLGTRDVQVVLTALAPDTPRLEASLARAREALREYTSVVPIWRQDCHALASEREPFGHRDGISHPAIEGSGIPGTNPHEPPLKADPVGYDTPPGCHIRRCNPRDAPVAGVVRIHRMIRRGTAYGPELGGARRAGWRRGPGRAGCATSVAPTIPAPATVTSA